MYKGLVIGLRRILARILKLSSLVLMARGFGECLTCSQMDEDIFISGQIGLVPRSMALPEPRSLRIELALAQQHVERIVAALQTGWAGNCPLVVFWTLSFDHIRAVKKLQLVCSFTNV
jgi:hypothetical protein